jgi:hypothetical protein
MPSQYQIKSAFQSPLDTYDGTGRRPVVFDIIGPDRVTSLLPPDLKMVLHVNPSSMGFTYAKTISRQQTLAGFVEYHWGSNPTEITFTMATGGFMRLYSGLSNITGPTPSNDLVKPTNMKATSTGGTRRETIAYDKYLDMLALFHNNGAIYDSRGNIVFQGQILITYDGGSWWGWFSSFSVEETAEKPYQFTLNANFTVERELHRTKSMFVPRDTTRSPTSTPAQAGNPPDVTPDPIDDAAMQLELDQAEADANTAIPPPPPNRGGNRAPAPTPGGGSSPSSRSTPNPSPPNPSPPPNPAPANPSGGGATFSPARQAIGYRPDGTPIYG